MILKLSLKNYILITLTEESRNTMHWRELNDSYTHHHSVMLNQRRSRNYHKDTSRFKQKQIRGLVAIVTSFEKNAGDVSWNSMTIEKNVKKEVGATVNVGVTAENFDSDFLNNQKDSEEKKSGFNIKLNMLDSTS